MNTQELNEKLLRFHNLLCWQQRTARHTAAGQNQNRGRVLALLKLQPELTVHELSDLLDLRQSDLKHALDPLVDAGCVEFEYMEHDGAVLVRLTETGRQTQTEDIRSEEDCGYLSPADLDALDELLDRAIAALEEQSGTDHESAFGRGWVHPHGAFPGHSHAWAAKRHRCGWPL